MKFKKGDKVRVSKDCKICDGKYRGKVGTVIKVDPECYPYNVCFKEDTGNLFNWFFGTELELVQEEQ